MELIASLRTLGKAEPLPDHVRANPYEYRTRLLRRIRWSVTIFIAGLFISGVTAFPLQTEVEWLARWCTHLGNPICSWISEVRTGLQYANGHYPFMAYGTDWLAFAHIMFAVLFVGAWVDPIRNRWLLQFGLIACAGIVPLALIAGAVRDIPAFWQLIDISFGVVGALPLLLALRSTNQLEKLLSDETNYL